jgi:hypothetical protein
MKTSVTTEIKVSVTFTPGEWVLDRGTWSVSSIDFLIYRDPSGQWFTHVAFSNFRAWRRNDQNTAWKKDRQPQYPGFWPRMEILPYGVLEALRSAYEAEGVSPEYLPVPEVSKGKGTPR